MVSKEIRYLGITITQELIELPKTNIVRVSKEVDTPLKRWQNLPITQYGRVNLVKMCVLPKFTYFLITSSDF